MLKFPSNQGAQAPPPKKPGPLSSKAPVTSKAAKKRPAAVESSNDGLVDRFEWLQKHGRPYVDRPPHPHEVIPYGYAPRKKPEGEPESDYEPDYDSDCFDSSEDDDDEWGFFSPDCRPPVSRKKVPAYCKCGRCAPPSPDEVGFAQAEVEELCCIGFRKKHSEYHCITKNPQFRGAVLCKQALEIAAMEKSFRETGSAQMPSMTPFDYRMMADRHAVWALYKVPRDEAGKVPLPSCVMEAIRSKFPLSEEEKYDVVHGADASAMDDVAPAAVDPFGDVAIPVNLGDFAANQ